jgi:CHAT domain-containing protein/Tfp pilus assembly protein PilF
MEVSLNQRLSFSTLICLVILFSLTVSAHIPIIQTVSTGAAGQKVENRPDAFEEAWRLNGQVGELYDRGRYDEAIPLAERSLLIFETKLGLSHPYVATALNQLGLLYQAKDDYARAEKAHRRALAIREQSLRPDHPDIGQSLSNLGLAYEAMGNYGQATALYQRALAIAENALGPAHPVVATVLHNLGEVYLVMGDYVRAEPLFQRAITIIEKALGPNDPWVATSLNHLALLYQMKGDYSQAEMLYQRSLEIREKVLGPNHPYVAQSLTNLASLYVTQGDHVQSEKLYQRALAILEKSLGLDHSYVAHVLSNLADLYRGHGEYLRAEPLYRRSLAIREKSLGSQHPYVANALNNLGLISQGQGDYKRAEELFRQSLAISEKSLGSEHFDVVRSLSSLGLLYHERGDIAAAVQFLRRANDILESNLKRILSTGSERQKASYLTMLASITYATVSLHARSAPSDQETLQLAYTTVLRRKGRVLDAVSDQITSLRQRLAPQDRALLDQLSTAQAQLSALILGGPDKAPPEDYKVASSRLAVEIDRLQDSISRRSAEFRVQTQPVTIEQVRQALPAHSALVEFFYYRPLNVKAKIFAEKFGTPRYAVYILRKEGEPLWTDLGEVADVEADISRLLVALRCPQAVDDIQECPSTNELKRLARAADERVMRSVRKLLGGTRQVFLSPDGALNLLPFAALVDENNKYLLENYSITYLTSGRDLLRLQLSAGSREPPLIVADPAFGNAVGSSATVQKPELAQPKRSGNTVAMNFDPLPGTAEEARTVASLLTDARMLIQDRATEFALKHVNGPSVLHIATHGFFLPDRPAEMVEEGRSLRLAVGGPGSRVLTLSENPLLRSGLALAGANLPVPVSREDDGILTALEAAGLNLWGTKLVVLSACETGVGKISNGEGVYGLRRALVLAGSESQVMSLWQVSDAATRNMMIGYYKRLVRGNGRSEALREVQLEMLRAGRRDGKMRGIQPGSAAKVKADYSHPYYWAGFIQSGDWRGMNFQLARPLQSEH